MGAVDDLVRGLVDIQDELSREQAYIDHAYVCLERARDLANRLTGMVEVGKGGTEQARYEREIIQGQVLARLAQLDVGDASLVFGRIDQTDEAGGDALHIGRLGVWDENQDPVVVDWRAPASEAFYRATGSEPMGLRRRRHFTSRGRELLALDDEVFGDLSGLDDGSLRGEGALLTALEGARSGRLGDIVGTIQAEQDRIIRAPLPGVLVVQGGPGTGKTVVALHRAAFLLYSHRFPLEGQGVLVVGPNRLFLAYVEQVLPSLGEAGVEMSTVGDLLGNVRVDGLDEEAVARIKGDARMVDVLGRAVRQRQRPLRRQLVVASGLQRLRLDVDRSETIVREARRRFRTHNAARRFIETEVFTALAESGRDTDPATVRDRHRHSDELREALEWMWPVLTPAHLLHDLFGSKALLRNAGRGSFSTEEIERLHRQRSEHADQVVWTRSDAPLLDEARSLLGPRPRNRDLDAIRTYGHIVVDEAQDLTPMELRVLRRRSLNGSMTLVGDIAQATGPWARDDWDGIVEPLRRRREARREELTIGYRIPAPLMDIAARVQAVAAPDLTSPVAVREQGDPPRVVASPGAGHDDLLRIVREELDEVDPGNVAIIVPLSMLDEVTAAIDKAGIEFGRATRRGLEQRLTVVPVALVKGIEVDSSIVVDPARMVAEEAQGHRALYVAITRATKRLSIVHAEPLPPVLAALSEQPPPGQQ